MNALHDFGNTLPGVYDTDHECLSLTTRRVTVMDRPADRQRARVNKPFACGMAVYLAAYVAAALWVFA
ncbi:hypothetical protein [Methylibium sp.]|uniref:hypothetical protein n=1 Tax=Methylibium sp. TaxID=2067992 RepID=UPI00183B790E|nr:hypothetical protein [Methylibium sp.]MBA3589687.1 hypothetical protein [Methylibium sp.]